MRRKNRARAAIAAVTVVVLIAASASALVVTRDDDREAPGLTRQYLQVDATYQRATQDFVDETKALEGADLRTALRLYGLALDAARDARTALGELPVVPETERPVERMRRALEVQEIALEAAIAVSRNRDVAGAAEATKQFQTAVLAYLTARADMLRGLDECGARCR